MRTSSLLLLVASAAIAQAGPLGPGAAAPALKVANIVKGKQVNLAKGVHVVEFWATWCGPCKVSIPHLTELAKKHKGKVDFTGVSVWENGDDQLGQVKKFVAEWGDKMDYNVAFDGEAKFMAENWMTAAGQNGIPASFLVKDGKILWIGHPMSGLDTAIDQVLAGTFDAAKAKADFDQRAKQAEAQQKMAAERQKQMKPFTDAIKAKDGDAILKAVDAIPAFSEMASYYRYMGLSQIGDARADEYGKKLADDANVPAETLNSIAWPMVMDNAKKPNYALGLYIAERAAKKTEMSNWMILDTYGLALFRNGQKDKAIEVQTKAVGLASSAQDADAASRKELAERLELFKKG